MSSVIKHTLSDITIKLSQPVSSRLLFPQSWMFTSHTVIGSRYYIILFTEKYNYETVAHEKRFQADSSSHYNGQFYQLP